MNKPCTHEIVQEAMRIVSKDVRTPKYVRDMSKIPIAEEFYKQITGCVINHKDIKISMIEFAKLHVEAAIKECIECAPSGSSTDTVSYEDVVEALTDCYPLNNIK